MWKSTSSPAWAETTSRLPRASLADGERGAHEVFTRQLWIDAQESGEAGDRASRQWDEAFAVYSRQLESLRLRLPPDVFEFFQNADVHDGALMHLRLRDFDPLAPTPATCDVEARDCGEDSENHQWEGPYRLTVELAVAERSQREWTLRYSGIRRIVVDFPSEPPLFFRQGDGFEDWGYHELSDAEEGFLRHEVLFSSGTVVLVEFSRSVSDALAAIGVLIGIGRGLARAGHAMAATPLESSDGAWFDAERGTQGPTRSEGAGRQ